MAYDDAARVDANTARMTDANGEQTAVRAAAKVFGEAIETQMETNGLTAGGAEIIAFQDKFVDLLRWLDHTMDVDNT
jgi:hypothetical protein